jgi:hypothetical protein
VHSPRTRRAQRDDLKGQLIAVSGCSSLAIQMGHPKRLYCSPAYLIRIAMLGTISGRCSGWRSNWVRTYAHPFQSGSTRTWYLAHVHIADTFAAFAERLRAEVCGYLSLWGLAALP